MKKTFVLIWITFLILISAIGCKNNELVTNGQNLDNDNEQLRIGIVLKALDSEHWQTMKKGAEKAARDLGIDLIVRAPDKETNVAMQFRLIEDLMDQNVDAIGIAPCDSTAIIPIIEEAKQNNIHVFTIDTDADTDVVSFIGTDNFLAGKMAGERIIEVLGGKGNVVLITGVLEQQTHRDRRLGFKKAIEGTEIEIIEQRQANSDSELAMEEMNQLFESHEDIDAVFATNALMALGVLEAIEANEKTDEIKLIGFDIQQELLEGVKNGKVDSVIAQNPYDMGYETVQSAVNYLRGEPVEKRTDTGTELITVENVDKYKEQYCY
ncbi:MAG: substrate-binding domain-containing protein [Clostridia bacterium]|nr:substrate-binding domain-containing protein [Clostridia bacterium]